MHRISLLVVFAAVGSACAAPSGDESFIIRSNLAVAEGNGCFLSPDLNAIALSRGQIFINSPIPYQLHPMFESRIVAPEGKESLRTVFLHGANVEVVIGPIETIDKDGFVNIDTTEETVKFKTLFSAALAPNGGLVAGEFDLISLDVLSKVRQRVAGIAATTRIHAQTRATATAFGDYYGDEINSNPFEFPVLVCNDCVVNVVSCPLPMTATPRQGNACNLFQDGIVDCCNDDINGLTCPAEVSTAPPGP